MAEKLKPLPKRFRRMESIVRTAAYLDRCDIQWCIDRITSDFRNRRSDR